MTECSVSIEIARIATEALVPISIAVVGWVLHERLQAIQSGLRTEIEVRKLRVAAYSELLTPLNDIYCFSTYVGRWREFSPITNLDAKREADGVFYRSLFLWTSEVIDAYRNFMDACFVTSTGREESAVSRANIERYREAKGESWVSEWEGCFVPPEVRSRRADVTQAYTDLHRNMALSVGHDIEGNLPT